MVLLAMLVPMAVLVRSYDLEDRLSRAALEVQGTETVVSGQDKGAVSVYLDGLNRRDDGVRTTVLYPDGTAIGPHPGEDARVAQARTTGRARVDDVDDGAQILVPVALGGSSGLPGQTPVVRVDVREARFPSDLHVAWIVLALLGTTLLAGAVLLADRLGRSFVRPIHDLAAAARSLGDPSGARTVEVAGPPEVEELSSALTRLVDRVELLLQRERENVADLSHRLRTPVTALRLGIEALDDADDSARLSADLDRLQQTVDVVVREARRSQREGVAPRTDALPVLAARTRYWLVLAEDQDRPVEVDLPDGPGPLVRAGVEDLEALADVLVDNVFTHTPAAAALRVTLRADAGSVVYVVEDGGPGVPDGDVVGRGASGSGSTGLGLAIAARTAEAAGGRLTVDRSPDLGGARVTVVLR
jgi:signal transduction histidine kinase